MKLHVIRFLRLLVFPLLTTMLFVAPETQLPGFAGACRRPPQIEATNFDILHIKLERLITEGEAQKDKPIVFEASVIEVLRGDKKKYPSRISVARASRVLVGYCQRPEYRYVSLPKPGEQFITAFEGTANGCYTEAQGYYYYSPALLDQVKQRLKSYPDPSGKQGK